MADVFIATRAAAVPAMPPSIHPPHEVHAFYAGLDLVGGEREGWVAEDGRGIVAFAELKGDWLDALYVRPDAQGEGIGAALLDVAKSLRPGGLLAVGVRVQHAGPRVLRPARTRRARAHRRLQQRGAGARHPDGVGAAGILSVGLPNLAPSVALG